MRKSSIYGHKCPSKSAAAYYLDVITEAENNKPWYQRLLSKFQPPAYNIIFAHNIRGGIGMSNKLPWSSKAELGFFKAMTDDSVVIMGRKTFESLPQYPHGLPNRVNIVITSKPFTGLSGYHVSSFEEALKLAATFKKRIWVIGGGHLITTVAANAAFIVRTRMNTKAQCDTYVSQEVLDGRLVCVPLNNVRESIFFTHYLTSPDKGKK